MYHFKFLICPGAQKAGTTSLYNFLAGHPDICVASKKETKYFLSDEGLEQDAYIKQYFRHCKEDRLLCDVDPDLLCFPETAERIHRVLGNRTAIAIMLRNPVDRAYSHYMMSYRRGYVLSSFDEAVDLELSGYCSDDLAAAHHLSFVSRGFYAKQIKEYQRFFPQDNMYFIIFEEFIRDKQASIFGLCEFLGLDFAKLKLPEREVFNRGGLPRFIFLSRLRGQRHPLKDVLKPMIPPKVRWKMYSLLEKINLSTSPPPQMMPRSRARLMGRYLDDIKRLESLINRDLSFWLNDD